MKNDPTQKLISARDTLVAAKANLAHLLEVQEGNLNSLRELELTVDFADTAALARITQHQTIDRLLPNRIANAEQATITAENESIAATNEFIGTVLNPRARRAKENIAIEVRKELRPHFPSDSLEMHVQTSERLQAFERLQLSITDFPGGGALMHAERVLIAWEKLTAIEPSATTQAS